MITNSILSLLVLTLISACDTMTDDQTIATNEQKIAVNPQLTPRNFEGNNKNHKVLVAIMDTGVDYNHPFLKDNIHFEFQDDKPVRTGWDLTGNDPWPAPYVARTNYLNYTLSGEDQEKSLKLLEANKVLIEEFPELAYFFPVERNIDEENSEAIEHGTHVAGLASYDSPEIGILPYRVIPMNIPNGFDSLFGLIDSTSTTFKFTKILMDGLTRAVEDGARVVNMSLGITSKETDLQEDKNVFEYLRKELTQFVDSNPHVIFVIAAGNDGEWVDGTKVTVLPCFIPRPNVICVSALTKDMERTDFTNIVKNDEMTTIFAWGNKILSTVPGKTCNSMELDFSTISQSHETLSDFGRKAMGICNKNQTLVEMSGTSMASPIIARKVAKIMAECLSCSATEIKNTLFEKTISGEIEGMPIFKLPIEKPSWYQDKDLKNKKFQSPSWNFFLFKK